MIWANAPRLSSSRLISVQRGQFPSIITRNDEFKEVFEHSDARSLQTWPKNSIPSLDTFWFSLVHLSRLQGKQSLPSRWNFTSTFTELHWSPHGNEPWLTEAASNTYLGCVYYHVVTLMLFFKKSDLLFAFVFWFSRLSGVKSSRSLVCRVCLLRHNSLPSSSSPSGSRGSHLYGVSDLMQCTPTIGRRPKDRLSRTLMFMGGAYSSSFGSHWRKAQSNVSSLIVPIHWLHYTWMDSHLLIN